MKKSRNLKLITEVGSRYSYEELLQIEQQLPTAQTKSRGLREVIEQIEETLSNFINKQKKRSGATLVTTSTETTPPPSVVVVPPVTTTTPPPPVVVVPPAPTTTTPPSPVVVSPAAPSVLNFSDLIQENLSDTEGQYYRAVFPKKQIYLHHTVSGGSPLSAINWWRKQSNGVATFAVIAGTALLPSANYKDGDIYQCFSSKYWAHHLGLKQEHLISGGLSNLQLNRGSIAIEICNWGPLSKNANGTFSPVDYPQITLAADEVQTYSKKYRGHQYYQRYTPAQIESIRKLLVYLCDTYKIDTVYKGDAIFDIDRRALKGESGIFTHSSVRPDKADCHPQPELIAMLKTL